MKRTVALIPLTILALALTGCSLGEKQDEEQKLSVDGEFVFAPAADGDDTFFAAGGSQGKALSKQFTDGCQTPETEEPTDEASDEGTQTPEPRETSPVQPGQGSQPSTAPTEGGES